MLIDEEYTMPLTNDGMCPFLSRHDQVCVIYDDRPYVCRAFGEIPELQCPRVNPKAAKLSAMQMAERISARLGIAI